MGLLGCDCRAFLETTGEFTIRIPVGPITVPVTADFSLAIDICPECELADSSVAATVTVDLPDLPIPGLPDEISASFEGVPVGVPLCENGTLTVQVAGTLSFNGSESDVTVTLVLDANEGEVCIQLPEALPIVGDEICIPVEGLEIEDCLVG